MCIHLYIHARSCICLLICLIFHRLVYVQARVPTAKVKQKHDKKADNKGTSQNKQHEQTKQQRKERFNSKNKHKQNRKDSTQTQTYQKKELLPGFWQSSSGIQPKGAESATEPARTASALAGVLRALNEYHTRRLPCIVLADYIYYPKRNYIGEDQRLQRYLKSILANSSDLGTSGLEDDTR